MEIVHPNRLLFPGRNRRIRITGLAITDKADFYVESWFYLGISPLIISVERLAFSQLWLLMIGNLLRVVLACNVGRGDQLPFHGSFP